MATAVWRLEEDGDRSNNSRLLAAAVSAAASVQSQQQQNQQQHQHQHQQQSLGDIPFEVSSREPFICQGKRVPLGG